MALSVRNLQWKLANKNTISINWLEHTKELLARNYLKVSNKSNEEIDFLIGNSVVNNFRRAVRSLTGITRR
jgi:hypothetical protein